VKPCFGSSGSVLVGQCAVHASDAQQRARFCLQSMRMRVELNVRVGLLCWFPLSCGALRLDNSTSKRHAIMNNERGPSTVTVTCHVSLPPRRRCCLFSSDLGRESRSIPALQYETSNSNPCRPPPSAVTRRKHDAVKTKQGPRRLGAHFSRRC
jgi:hypothetical protein